MTTTSSSTSRASTDPIALSFAVTLETLGQARIAAWVFPPHYQSDLLPALWLFCIPGATYRGLAYYDRQVPGYVPFAYSMVRTCAGNGIGSVVIDNLGTGESRTDIPSAHLTAPVLAEAYHQLIQQLRQRLQDGELVPGLDKIVPESLWLAGVGHSMGSFLLTHLQGRHQLLDAVVLLGLPYQPDNVAAFFSSFGSESDFQAFMEKAWQDTDDPQMVREMRVFARRAFYSSAVPQALIEADEQDATGVPLGLFRELMDLKEAAQWSAKISTPVYIGLGELEVPHPREEPAMYLSSHSITVFVQPGVAHCANFEESRLSLWADLIAWCRARSALSSRLRLNRWLFL
jgi:pimeloyl-ACP methyl ester carboxylesterase